MDTSYRDDISARLRKVFVDRVDAQARELQAELEKTATKLGDGDGEDISVEALAELRRDYISVLGASVVHHASPDVVEGIAVSLIDNTFFFKCPSRQ